jgi:hypothetical protein
VGAPTKRFLLPASIVLVFACLLSTVARGAAGSAGTTCPRLSQAGFLPARSGGGRLQGDIDGDGRPDRVSIRYAPKAAASCGFLLVVETQERVLAVRIPEWYKPPQDLPIRKWWLPEPYLARIVQLQPHRDQIVVARSEGAANKNVSLYGLVAGRLERLRFRPSMYEDELSLFGTVGTGVTNVRCVRGGPLIVLNEWPTSATGTRWSAARRTYRLVGGILLRATSRTITGPERRIATQARTWGFDALPFTGCTTARGRRL